MVLRVNGVSRRVEAERDVSLLEVLRDHLELTGAKYGCGEGQCGACMVLIDGRPSPACVTPLSAAEGAEVTTVEGLATGEDLATGEGRRLHPVQQAFVDAGALQCGYCTPGMVVSAVALLRQHPRPDEAAIARFMQPHLCRCGVYPRITRAIHLAAERLAAE